MGFLNVCVFARAPIFSSFGYTPSSGIAGSYGSGLFFLFRNHQAVFLQYYTELLPVPGTELESSEDRALG